MDAGSWRAGRGDHCLQGSRLVELVGLCAVSAAAHRLPQGPPWFSSIRAQPSVYEPSVYEDKAGFEARTLGRGSSRGGWLITCCWGAPRPRVRPPGGPVLPSPSPAEPAVASGPQTPTAASCLWGLLHSPCSVACDAFAGGDSVNQPWELGELVSEPPSPWRPQHLPPSAVTSGVKAPRPPSTGPLLGARSLSPSDGLCLQQLPRAWIPALP